MIASRLKTIRQSREDRFAVVNNFRSLAVHHLRRADHTSAKSQPNRLMTESNAEQRNFARKALDHFQRDARGVRCAWSG
jgi:hypothetical protein